MSIRFNPAITALLITSLAGCAFQPQTEDDALASEGEELYYWTPGVWSDPSISVCWLSDANPDERDWIKVAVEKAIETFTDVDFTGWGICNGGAAEVVIDTSDANWPVATLGARSAATTPNLRLNHFNGAPRDLNGGGIDFDGCWTGQASSGNPVTGTTGRSWASNHRRCVEVTAVHEFFHILSMAHEQVSPDAPPACAGTPPENPEDYATFGYWDVTSVSNYCNPVWNGDGLLSPLDYTGLNTFYGFGPNDQTWFGIGNARNYGNAVTDQIMFDITRHGNSVTGSELAVIGDFTGTGRDDILLYGSSSRTDAIFFGRADRTLLAVAETITGTYKPAAGDFDGDGKDDIFWYAPGSAQDKVWWGRSSGATFDKLDGENATGNFEKALAGDFDGDGRHDIFWYVSGATADKLWFGRADRTFDKTTPTNISNVYQPFVGDFDGDGKDDIFLYKPGTGQDKIWYGKADRTFESVEITVNGTYNPAAGDFDGNGTTDVVWSGANVTEPMWLFSDTERGERIAIHTSSMLGSDTAGGDSVPYAGDFDGNGFADLYWFKP